MRDNVTAIVGDSCKFTLVLRKIKRRIFWADISIKQWHCNILVDVC